MRAAGGEIVIVVEEVEAGGHQPRVCHAVDHCLRRARFEGSICPQVI